MIEDIESSNALEGQVVAVPESRQLDILVDLLLRRGAKVLRVPLVSILDAPDPVPIERWLSEFIANPPDYLIVLTGEGLRRLCGVAERSGFLQDFIAGLGKVCKICRGPKPGRALKELDLKPDMLGKEPTTPGIIAALDELDLQDKRVAVQLYGEEPNQLLIGYLHSRGALVSSVAPYIYAPDSDEHKVVELINDLTEGRITMMTFTSQPQFIRLQEVARKAGIEERLLSGLSKVSIAAVGPVVADQLRAAGVAVAVMPESLFFMKPMVTELVKLARSGSAG
ncbi:MAG: uroporphyrinogen-III synthase [Gammaproteobacteria bacterium]|nr:uroporphyrinogen-III synthase [Gammaproteobacteria bacterium]MDP2140878.1 uroporphyrinogen-III synthase [Gammaproteobacteria bacterium]MDP2349378.1 uroporphyrinogen-III synthase [Gammaproteobacteria bacterium]